MKTLEESLDEAWADTKKLYGYPPLKKPEFKDSTSTAAIDMSNHGIKVNKRFVRLVSQGAAKENYPLEDTTILKGLLHHEVNHYMYCPYDFPTMLRIEDEISKVADENVHTIGNYFTDVVINLDLMKRKKRMEVSEVYRHIDKNHPVDQLMCAIYQDKTRTDFGVRLKAADMRNRFIALRRIDYLNKKKWLKSSKRFANLIKDLITEDNKKDLMGIDDWDTDSYTDGEIEKGLGEMAKELDPKAFRQAVKGAGIKGDSIPQGIDGLFYEHQSKKYMMDVLPRAVKGQTIDHNEHKKYEISDTYGSIDVFNSYGKFMPGFSQVWNPVVQSTDGTLIATPDLALAIDTSLSMPDPREVVSPAVMGAFCAAKLYLDKGSSVATYNFSDGAYVTPFSREKSVIYKNLAMFQGGGTELNVGALESLINSTRTKADLIMITDMEIYNFEETMDYLKRIEKANRISILWIDPEQDIDVRPLQTENFHIYKIRDNDDIPKIIIGEAK